MSALYIVLSVLYGLSCVALITVILLQKKRSAGLGNTMSGMGSSQTYWDKNKGRSLEGTLEKYTKLLGFVFFALSFILCLVK